MVTVINSPSVKLAYCCLADDTTETSLIKCFWFQVRGRSLPTWLVGKGPRSHTGRLFPCENDLTPALLSPHHVSRQSHHQGSR